MNGAKTFLALGDSMSIDDYTGVKGGGAVHQFVRTLGKHWALDDRTFDGCQMAGVPRDRCGDLITLTIGGNDLLLNQEKYLRAGISDFQRELAALLAAIRRANPGSTLLVGGIYEPALPLSITELQGLAAANAAIYENCDQVHAIIVPIHDTFQDHSGT
jgi:hypothetical protein